MTSKSERKEGQGQVNEHSEMDGMKGVYFNTRNILIKQIKPGTVHGTIILWSLQEHGEDRTLDIPAFPFQM